MNSISHEDAIKKSGFIIYHVRGESMLPLLSEKDNLVKINRIDKPIKIYDVVLFKRENGEYPLHRVVGEKDGVYDIVGDNQIQIEKVKREQIIGVAVGKYKGKEYIPFEGEEYEKYVNDICKDITKRKISYRYKDIKDEYIELLKLVKASINNEKYHLNCDVKTIYNITLNQNLLAFTFKSLYENEIDKNIYDEWSERASRVLKKEILYDNLRNKLIKDFEKNEIKFMLLKGIEIKELYPSKGLRDFADNDILYDSNKYDELKEIMKKYGFEEVTFGNWIEDVFHKDDYYSIEMHRSLFSDDFKVFDEYFKDIFDRSSIDINNSYKYNMTDIDFYIYFIAHMYKHFNDSGAGLRLYVDLYYVRKKMWDAMDKELLDSELNKIGLKNFHDKAVRFLDQILNEDYSDVDSINFAMMGTVYGTRDNSIVNSIKKHGKIGYLFKRIFLPLNSMQAGFPILRKLPILLPLFWIVRAFKDIFKKEHRNNIIKEMTILKRK